MEAARYGEKHVRNEPGENKLTLAIDFEQFISILDCCAEV